MSDFACAKRHYYATGHAKKSWGYADNNLPGTSDEYCKTCKTGEATVEKYKDQLKNGGEKMDRPPVTGFPVQAKPPIQETDRNRLLNELEEIESKATDTAPETKPEKKCKNGCDRKVAARGLCWKCYNEVRTKEAAEERRKREAEWGEKHNEKEKPDKPATPKNEITINELKEVVIDSLRYILRERDTKTDVGALKVVIETLGAEVERLEKENKNRPKLVSGNRTNTFTISNELAGKINKIAIHEFRTPLRQIYYFLEKACIEYNIPPNVADKIDDKKLIGISCPFCKGTDIEFEWIDDADVVVICSTCGAFGPFEKTAEMALYSWLGFYKNRRLTPKP
jgi:hypothetical protein